LTPRILATSPQSAKVKFRLTANVLSVTTLNRITVMIARKGVDHDVVVVVRALKLMVKVAILKLQKEAANQHPSHLQI